MNIVLDFDRTLFDTKAFTDWFSKEVSERSGRTVAAVLEEAEKTYYIHSEDLYYYDMLAQLESIFGDKALSHLESIKQKAIETKNFLFDDVKRNLSLLSNYGKIFILTYGKEDYQIFKLSLCAELKDVPVDIVMSPKGPHLEKNFDSAIRCVFVDDKDAHGELPDWVEFYQIVRNEAVVKSNNLTIRSFDELVSIVITKTKAFKDEAKTY